MAGTSPAMATRAIVIAPWNESGPLSVVTAVREFQMRSIVFAILFALSVPAAADPRELVTASRAILCLNAASLDEANAAELSQQSLRRLHCMRTEAGIRSTLVSGSSQSEAWEVLFRPAGISAGVRLWGRPAAFTEADRAALPIKRASR